MANISLSREHYTFPNGNFSSIMTNTGYFLDVEKDTEKAVQFHMFGRLHWLPKSAFVGKDYGDNVIVFSIKPFFQNQLNNKY
jgi:hypothetical protein